MKPGFRLPISAMDETNWKKVTALFDELLAGADLEIVLASESNPQVRAQTRELWEEHLRATEEGFLGKTMSFEVLPVFRTGDKLLNRFRIDGLLGAGGMGEVYRAFDERIEEPVAIKTIARLLAHSPAIRRRIAAEVQNARRVTHPNVCRIHELFDAGDTVFFSMELIEGPLLSDVLANPIDKKRALLLIRQIAEGLHAAHRTGVVHGDLKPSNIILEEKTEVRAVLMDFGLARAIDHTAPRALGAWSLQAGTLDYMAPELHAGGAPNIRSDIFAFGKLASALCPGERFWHPCLRPHPEERIGSLESVIRALASRSPRRYWLGGAGTAVLALVGYSAFRLGGPRLTLPNGARVLVNGFRTLPGASRMARVARGLFISGVAQSPRIHPLADEDLFPALKKLAGGALPVNGRILDILLAQLHAPFWIDGDFTQSGGRNSLVLRLLRSEDRLLLTENAFRDFSTVSGVASEAATWLRAASGESRRSLRINEAAPSVYLSDVPEALSKFYDAMELYAVADMEQAVPLFREALRLDESFAQAHAMLSSCLHGIGDFEEGFQEADRAMQLAYKLPERERTAIEAIYYSFAGNSAKAIEAARRNLSYHPDEARYLRVLASNLARSGDLAEAIVYNRKATELAPDDALQRTELVENLASDGQYEEALRTFEERSDLAGISPYFHRGQAMALMGLERYEEASNAYRKIQQDVPCWLASPKIMAGDLENAIASLREAAARAEAHNLPQDSFEIAEFLCGLYVVTDRLDLAVTQVRKMLATPRVPSTARYLDAAVFWASRVGDDASLLELRDRLLRNAMQWPSEDAHAWLDHANALVSLRNRDMANAENLLVRACGFPGARWSFVDLAELYAARGSYDAAEAEWQAFNRRQGWFLYEFFPGVLVMGWLGRALVARSRRDAAATHRYSKKVLDHWGAHNSRLKIVQLAETLAVNSI